MLNPDETICAIASPSSPAIRGIVRISGEQMSSVLAELGIQLRTVNRPTTIDQSIDLGHPLGDLAITAMVWPTSRSYTGQPSAEIHTVGSLPVLQAIIEKLVDAGARPARPGEFTMRAFLAGRLDLTQAEAVLGVIEAEQRGSLNAALRQLAGNLSTPLERMLSQVLDLLADVEAGLDFVDEDIEFVSDSVLCERLCQVEHHLVATMETLGNRSEVSERTVIAFRGKPNAGKSRLVNVLANREAAIVANIAGTTRDSVTVETSIDGHQVLLVDTAGIESTTENDWDESIINQSQMQAGLASQHADIRIWCVDASCSDLAAVQSTLQSHVLDRNRHAEDVWVATKTDLVDHSMVETEGWVRTSAVSGDGIGLLRQRLAELCTLQNANETGSVTGTAARVHQSLEHAIRAIRSAGNLVRRSEGHEFVASELRQVAECLGEVTGAVYTDDILDRVFSRFCIGK